MSVPTITARHSVSVNESFDFHFHDSYELYFFISGQGEMMVENTRYSLAQGSLLVFNSNEIHRVSPIPDIPYERITVHFSPELILSMPVKSSNLLACFQNHRPGIGNAVNLKGKEYENYFLLSKKLAESAAADTQESPALSYAYLIELLTFTNRLFAEKHALPTSSPAFSALPFEWIIADAISYIESRITEEISLAGLAKALNVDLFYLSHRFKEQTGASPYHYILIRRIALAKQLLSKGSNCQEVCSSSGFSDYNNFARTFKKYVGLSPAAYKKSLKQ